MCGIAIAALAPQESGSGDQHYRGATVPGTIARHAANSWRGHHFHHLAGW